MTLLLDIAMAATQALQSVEEGKAPADLPGSLAVHRDVQLALLFGSRSALAFLVMASFWLGTAWTAAPGGMILTCVVCSLFASRENGAQIGMSFLRGILMALPVAFFVGQIVLPQWSGFPMLCMAMGVPLFFGALGMANPRIGATATSFCLHFYMQAYFDETKLPRIQVGAKVKVWLMSAGEPMEGEVESISRGITDRNATPDSQLLAEVEPTFNWVRLAQRTPLRIKFAKVPEGVQLSAGMTASVQVQEDSL